MTIKPQNGLLGFASLVIDNAFYLGSIGIHKKLSKDDYRLTYPTKVVGGSNINIYHPINREISKQIEDAVFRKYKDVMNLNDDRYNSA